MAEGRSLRWCRVERLDTFDHVLALVDKRDFGEIQHLNQPESLIRPIKAQAQAIFGELDDDWPVYWVHRRVGQLDVRIGSRKRFEAG
jgi:hypothetical protein